MPDYALVGDIGGTHARFALTDLDAPRPSFERERTLGDSGYASLQAAAHGYLEATGARPRRAVLAVASPLQQDEIKLTNRGWSFRRGELQRALGLDALHLVNDFAAIAWATPYLAAGDRVAIHGAVATPPVAPVTLIGAGTGLGVALLTGSAEQRWHVVPTEGGHAGFAPVDDEDRVIAAWLRKRYGQVSSERVLSGEGLACIDAALRGVTAIRAPGNQPGLRAPETITAAAMADTDAEARHALARFCRIYGAVAGDAALLHGAKTVLIAGGVVLHFLDFFQASDFMNSFSAKGRFDAYMQRMAVQVITHPNPGLLGAAAAARVL